MKYALVMMLFFADGQVIPGETSIETYDVTECAALAERAKEEVGAVSVVFECALVEMGA